MAALTKPQRASIAKQVYLLKKGQTLKRRSQKNE
jgi:hypothetical protein